MNNGAVMIDHLKKGIVSKKYSLLQVGFNGDEERTEIFCTSIEYTKLLKLFLENTGYTVFITNPRESFIKRFNCAKVVVAQALEDFWEPIGTDNGVYNFRQ